MLLFPPNLSTGISPGIPLIWNCAFGASTYKLHIDDGAGFIRDLPGITQTSFVVPGLVYSTTYHWRWRPRTAHGARAWLQNDRRQTQHPPTMNRGQAPTDPA